MFIVSLILGVVTACLALSASKRFGEEKRLAFSRAGIILAGMTLINTFASKVPFFVALLFYIIMLAGMGYLVYWWREEGSNIKELLTFAVMFLLMMWVTKACGARIYDVTTIKWIAGTIVSIPQIVCIMSVGYMVANMIWWHSELENS